MIEAKDSSTNFEACRKLTSIILGRASFPIVFTSLFNLILGENLKPNFGTRISEAFFGSSPCPPFL